jgi:UDP-N-acetylmuramyl pentapeptide phosphotransferase/UDP-N-acetylglucosamine-1-phosphate transferase
MLNIFTAFFTSFLITFLAVPPVVRVASIRQIFDEPNERKVHKRSIPALGGVAMFAAIFFSIVFWADGVELKQLRWTILPLFIIFMQGLKDDIVAIAPIKKLIGQLAAAGILIFWGNIRIMSINGLFGIHELPYILSIILTFLAIILIVNSFNLIDGVDGLAGSIGVVTTVAFGGFFLYIQHGYLALISFTLTGALLGFLWYNFSPARIFMGDGGSLVIGMVLAILSVRFLESRITIDSTIPIHTPSMVLAILIIPLADTIRVFIVRIAQGRSPFDADRNHIHHLLLKLGLTHRSIALTLALVNTGFILTAFMVNSLGANASFGIIAGLGLTSSFILHQVASKTKPAHKKTTLAVAKSTV